MTAISLLPLETVVEDSDDTKVFLGWNDQFSIAIPGRKAARFAAVTVCGHETEERGHVDSGSGLGFESRFGSSGRGLRGDFFLRTRETTQGNGESDAQESDAC